MIVGTGIDISQISRFKKFTENEHFLNKYFHIEEIEYIRSKGIGAAQSLAGKFAAREAFFKALGTGFSGFSPKDISIINNSDGRPVVIPGEKVTAKLNSMYKSWKIHLSISHEKEYAVAQVILED